MFLGMLTGVMQPQKSEIQNIILPPFTDQIANISNRRKHLLYGKYIINTVFSSVDKDKTVCYFM